MLNAKANDNVVNCKDKKLSELPGYLTHQKEKDRRNIYYQEVTSQLDANGTVELAEFKRVKKVKEGDFIKLYLEDICYLHNLQANQHEILYHLLKRMSYDNLIVVNKAIKEIIANDTGKALSTIDNAISAYVKEGILIRKGRGLYLANPYLFGKGKFENVEKIRMQLEYTTQGITIKSEIDKGSDDY